jgi:hypothetical protein
MAIEPPLPSWLAQEAEIRQRGRSWALLVERWQARLRDLRLTICWGEQILDNLRRPGALPPNHPEAIPLGSPEREELENFIYNRTLQDSIQRRSQAQDRLREVRTALYGWFEELYPLEVERADDEGRCLARECAQATAELGFHEDQSEWAEPWDQVRGTEWHRRLLQGSQEPDPQRLRAHQALHEDETVLRDSVLEDEPEDVLRERDTLGSTADYV